MPVREHAAAQSCLDDRAVEREGANFTMIHGSRGSRSTSFRIVKLQSEALSRPPERPLAGDGAIPAYTPPEALRRHCPADGTRYLLADTKPRKNFSEQIVRRVFAGDGAKLVLREP